jgi:chaperone protein EcpD
MKLINKLIFSCFFLLSFLSAQFAHANIVINGTRVIYPSNEQEVNVKLNNVGTSPLLVQTWLDKGNPKSRPDEIKVPFILTPPLFRLDANKGQTLRLIYTQEALPQEKESIFWLNVLEVPPKPSKNVGANWLQVAFRTRIKVFFRPESLNKQSQVQKAPSQVVWTLQSTPKGYALLAKNPTPYFITIPEVILNINNKKLASENSAMLPPFGQEIFNFKNLVNRPAGTLKINFSSINDWGASTVVESSLTLH